MANPWDKPSGIANPWDKSSAPQDVQGNMYTQSAQDIQYSPEGIPLNTSSYGIENPYQKTTQALTSAVSLPINVATGIAKSPAALMQIYDKLIGGGNTGDNMVNAINQIEQGTQAQMGGVGSAASQVGSVVGQAAPYVGIGTAGMIPSFAQKVAQGAGVGALSGALTPEQTGLNPEQFANAKAQNIGIQSAIGGAFPVVGKLVSALRGTKLSPQMINSVTEARQAGYTLPPTQAGGGVANRLLEGIAGKASTLQEASVRNQEITNKLAAKSLGLSEDAILSPELIKGIRNKAGSAYENIGLSGTINPNATYIENLNKIAAPFIKTAEAFPNAKPSPVIELVESLKSPSFDASAAVEKIKQLRTAADDAFRTGNTDIGSASKKIANEIENTIQNHLESIKQPQLLDKFKEARQLIAKTYEIEKAMNKTTGTVNAQKLASRLQAGKPLSGELKDVAKFAQAFPKASQTPERIGGTIGISPLDATAAGLTFGGSLLGGQDKGSSAFNAALALGIRPAARKLVLSGPMQNRLVQQQIGAPGAIKNALPSSYEQQQLAKLLLMQSAGKAAQ